jgi:hypothetical protein
LSWTWEDLRVAQQNDIDLACIIDWIKQSTEQPPWKTNALKSHNIKTLWYQWPRLQIREGILKRRFEDIKTNELIWQIILPYVFREEFLRIAHSGMSGSYKFRICCTTKSLLAILVFRFENAYQFM